MKILITGGSGFLGTALTNALTQNGVNGETATVTWVSRSATQGNVNTIGYSNLATTNETYDIIINLAGAGIADSRWTDTRKQELLDSRLKPTQAVVDYIQRIADKPKLLISGSAIGWYGVQDESDRTALDENSPTVKTDFAHELCEKWENLAKTVSDIVPVTIIRTGVVIAPNGGMVTRLVTPFKMGTGGQLGNGKQMMSFISKNDWVRAVVFVIEQNLSENPFALSVSKGKDFPMAHHEHKQNVQVYNLTAPTPATNYEFTKAMGEWLHRPTFMTMPACVVKAMFGEMGQTLLLDGQRVVPKALMDKGFEFKDLTVLDALTKG
ncbi:MULTISPECIES: epimerase [unclassified Moraxella]|uniref:epimerase n=1 Tax=unclassified Moraxella TaxID=2685852 RepID=UPI003AF689BB